MIDAKERILETVRIAQNCPADWGMMVGDNKQRYCNQCELNVFNLSAMTAAEAENFLCSTMNEKSCIRFYKRLDGKIMTSDCPLGVKVIDCSMRYGRFMYEGTIALLVFVTSILFSSTTANDAANKLRVSLDDWARKMYMSISVGNRIVP